MNEVVYEAYGNNLKNRLFGLLCEFEKDREWEKYLDSILLELRGFEEERKTINYYKLYYKLVGLRYVKYEYFRSIVFDCMNLISRI